MSSRQRGPPPPSMRQGNPQYNSATYPRRNSTDEREALGYIDPHSDRPYLTTPRSGGRDAYFEGEAGIGGGPYMYRPRTESNVSNMSNTSDNGRRPRINMRDSSDDSRGKNGSSPGPLYREEARARTGQSNGNLPRDKYYGNNEYQPPQFPQNPYGNRTSSISVESVDSAGRRSGSRPNSRTQSPIPPYPPTPPPSSHHRFDNTTSPTPTQPRRPGTQTRTQTTVDTESKKTDTPPQLAPLQFSPPRPNRETSWLIGTPFDDLSESEAMKNQPPVPTRPPPLPPVRQQPYSVSSPRTAADLPRIPQTSPLSRHINDPDVPVRTSPSRDDSDEEWTLDNVLEFLRQNGFGESWQQAFRAADIHGDKFRSLGNYAEARKLLSV